MRHQGTLPLETPRLLLRPFVSADAPAAFRNWTGDARVTTFLRWPTHTDVTVTQHVIDDWVAQYGNPAFYQWAIVLKDLGEPIGSISVVDSNERTDMLHIGYCIGSRWWKQGYTSEAFARVIAFAFDQIGAQRIESQHDPDNPASGRVMQKCGLTCEGTLRRADWSNRGIVDACLYALLVQDYDINTAR